jgi:hypothetical protein
VKQTMLGFLVASALVAGGCAQSSTPTDTSTTTPAAPTTPVVTENFSGTVAIGGHDLNSFTVTANNANITLALTSAGPPSTIFEGFGIGVPVAGSCQLLTNGYGTYQAGTTPQLGGTIPSGAYCVMVFDVGNQIAPITYTVVVTHY